MWVAPGTSWWPMMCARVLGTAYESQTAAVSAAEAEYSSSVKYSGWSTHPSCSMPMLRVL